jgi:CheB methylesterase
VRLSRTPPQNGHRPAIDRLFTSAAEAYGPRVTAVILSGALDDGSLGLWDVENAGGAALVQDPAEALYPDMPLSASLYVPSAQVLALSDLAARIVELTQEPPQVRSPVAEPRERPWSDLAAEAHDAASIFTCPECNGPLLEDERDGVLKFRCRVGHVYSAESGSQSRRGLCRDPRRAASVRRHTGAPGQPAGEAADGRLRRRPAALTGRVLRQVGTVARLACLVDELERAHPHPPATVLVEDRLVPRGTGVTPHDNWIHHGVLIAGRSGAQTHCCVVW